MIHDNSYQLKCDDNPGQQPGEEFDALAATMPDIVYRISEDGRFTYLNPAIRLLGYEPEELVGKHFFELILPADAETVSRSHVLPKYTGRITGDKNAPKLLDERRNAGRKTAGLEVRLVPKAARETRQARVETLGERYIVAEISSSGIYQVNPGAAAKVFIGTIGIIKDVTEHKWMEAELRKYTEHLEDLVAKRTEQLERTNNQLQLEKVERGQAEEILRLVFESVGEGIAVIDPSSRILQINNVAMLLFGYAQKEELIGQSVLELVVERERSKVMAAVLEALQKGRSGYISVTGLKKDSSQFSAEVELGVLRDASFRATGFVIAIGDVTERKWLQEQLIVADRLASIGELAAGIAHELNNPLTSVIGFSQLLLEKEIPADFRKEVEVICAEAGRAAHIVKNLLTFSRKHEPEKQPVDVNTVIQKVLDIRAYEQKVHNIRVMTNFASDLPKAMGDYYQLQQVFTNIVINAEYFIIETHNRGTLTVTTEMRENSIKASFADDGPGINPEVMGHVFDPFFTTKPVGKGTGLGLSICHGIVTGHGGKIYAESEFGKGATFVVELPIKSN